MDKLSPVDMMFGVCGVAAVLFVLWALGRESATAPLVIDEIRGSVRYVVDGDSLYTDGHAPQIRLWGVDAPERNESGFAAATSTLKRIALRKAVTCQRMDTDRYEPTVARCFLKDSREINAEMIASGAADEYHRFSKGFYANRTD